MFVCVQKFMFAVFEHLLLTGHTNFVLNPSNTTFQDFHNNPQGPTSSLHLSHWFIIIRFLKLGKDIHSFLVRNKLFLRKKCGSNNKGNMLNLVTIMFDAKSGMLTGVYQTQKNTKW